MDETNQTYPNLVTKIQVYMSNKTQNSNYFSLLRKSGSYKNMLNFMAIVYINLFFSVSTRPFEFHNHTEHPFDETK